MNHLVPVEVLVPVSADGSNSAPAACGLVHRIGGGSVANLRLKPAEVTLTPPGISVLAFDTPGEAAAAIRAAFPKAKGLHAAAATVGSATMEAIRGAGFDVLPDPTARFPTHYRVIHPDGAPGFTDENLARLAGAFVDSTGHGPMAPRPTHLIDPAAAPVAALDAAPVGDHFEGTAELRPAPRRLRELFEEYEAVVEGQVFSLLDDVEGRIAAARLRVVFDDGAVAPVCDLQVFPSTGAVSFRTHRPYPE